MGRISSRWSQPVNQTQPVGNPEPLGPWGGGYPEPWMPRIIDGPSFPPMVTEKPGAFQPDLPQPGVYPPMQTGGIDQLPTGSGMTGGLIQGRMHRPTLGSFAAPRPPSWLSRGTAPMRGLFSSFLVR